MSSRQSRFGSVATASDPFVFLILALSIYAITRHSRLSTVEIAVLLSVVSSAASIGLRSLDKRHRAFASHPHAGKSARTSGARRCLGSLFGVAVIVLLWLLIPEYDHLAYRPLHDALPLGVPLFAVAVVASVLYGEWRLGPAGDDDVEQFCKLLIGPWPDLNWTVLRGGAASWLVKGFFLPLNFCELCNLLGRLRASDTLVLSAPWPLFVQFTTTIIYAVLLVAIIPGYLFGSRIFGNQVRRTDQSWFGWGVTLSCYNPLADGVFDHWFNYHAAQPHPSWATPWVTQSGGVGSIAWLLGSLIILLEIIHWWGESIFGHRASNLTNRGIITNGPYRFCKHPVYLSKCLGWFLIWLPPLAGASIIQDVRLTILWLSVCGIYASRAWVEERLLSSDPAYAEYAHWIDQHGLFSALGRYIPCLSYAWRELHWASAKPVPPTGNLSALEPGSKRWLQVE